MRLPAVAIAGAFATGIAASYGPGVATAGTRVVVLASLLAGGLALGAAIFLQLRQRFVLAWMTALAAWIALGFTASAIGRRAPRSDDVLQRLAAGELSLQTPLRWRGTLRAEPAPMPYGTALEIELKSVRCGERELPLTGGMRVSFTAHGEGDSLPALRAGDDVSVVAQARLPQVYRDEGAFDRRAYLQAQGIELTASLRSPELLEVLAQPPPSLAARLPRLRHRLRESLTAAMPGAPQEAAVLRAMLLGDRSFLERSESVNFQKTGVFHVLVVAGLHVGAFAAFLFWLARKARLSRSWTIVTVAAFVLAYLAIVEQRPPVLRAALMTFVVLAAMLFYRRVELSNSVAVAALVLLVAAPGLLADSSFQLSFLAMFCIAGIAAPWMDATLAPHARGLRGWRDVTRDAAHAPAVAQFRIDLRTAAAWLEGRFPISRRIGLIPAGVFSIAAAFRIAEIVILTLVLQLGMLPLLARDFHRVTLSGPLANLLAVPLTGVLVPLGFVTLALVQIVPGAAAWLVLPLRWLTTALLHVVAWVAHFPRWSYRIPGPPTWLLVAFFAGAVALALVLRLAPSSRWPSRRASPPWIRRSALAMCLLLATLIATHPFAPQFRSGVLELTVLDVGQGDSLLLVSPAGRTMLVDGGGAFTPPGSHSRETTTDPGEDAVSAYLWWRGFRRLDVVALTHAHQDHIGGLLAVVDNFQVGTLWLGREVASTQQQALEAMARAKGTRVVHEIRGQQFEWDGAQGEFLWPQIAPEEVGPSAKNDDSLVFRIRLGQESFLLPGDAEKSAERQILAESEESALRADVLKVGHHGSKNSTTPEFLAAVAPRVALISAGEENPYGHPSPQLLERLQQAGVPILRTDRSGAIHVFTDGKSLEVSCFVACADVSAQLRSPRPETPQQQESAKQ